MAALGLTSATDILGGRYYGNLSGYWWRREGLKVPKRLFNGKLRDELLNLEIFDTLFEAKSACIIGGARSIIPAD